MGSDAGENHGFNKLSGALKDLKEELLRLRDEDVVMLKELMKMHSNLQLLKGKLRLRSYKSGSFTTLLPENRNQRSIMSPPTKSKRMLIKECAVDCVAEEETEVPPDCMPVLPPRVSMLSHMQLNRVMSEPGKSLIRDRSISVTSEEDGDASSTSTMNRVDSFASNESEETDQFSWSFSANFETNNVLKDMPDSLRRHYLNSLSSPCLPVTDSVERLPAFGTPSPKNLATVKFTFGESFSDSQEFENSNFVVE